jgi:hypothetical protein
MGQSPQQRFAESSYSRAAPFPPHPAYAKEFSMPRPCLVVNTVLLLCVTSTGWAQDPDTTIRKVIVTRRSLETVTQKATGFTFVGSDTLVRACTLAHSKGYDTLKTTRSPAHILAAFCALGAPSVDANSMKAWNVATVPPADDIIRVAENDSLLTSDVQVVVQVDTVVLSSPLLLTNSNLFTGFGGSLGSFESTAIVGTTNWVVGRAKEEVSVYVVNQFARNLCSAALGRKISRPGAEDLVIRDSLLSYFPNTCQLLSRGSPAMLLGSGYGLPSWSVVQVKLRADLDVLPDTVFSRLRNVGAEAFTGSFNDPKAAAPIQRTLAAIGIGRLSVSYIKKHEMPIAFSEGMSLA